MSVQAWPALHTSANGGKRGLSDRSAGQDAPLTTPQLRATFEPTPTARGDCNQGALAASCDPSARFNALITP